MLTPSDKLATVSSDLTLQGIKNIEGRPKNTALIKLDAVELRFMIQKKGG